MKRLLLLLALTMTLLSVRSEELYKDYFVYEGTIVINGLKYEVTLPEDGNGEALLVGAAESAAARGTGPNRLIYFELPEEIKFQERDVTRVNGRVSPPPMDFVLWDSRRRITPADDDNYQVEEPAGKANVSPDKQYTCVLKVIGTMAFSDDTELENAVIPEGVVAIWNSAFSGCTNLKNVTLPSSLLYMSDGIFRGCSSLTNVSLPDNVEEMGGGTFSQCEALTAVNLPSSLRSLRGWTFYQCKNLTSINIPASLEEIPTFTFYECEKLQTVTGGQSVKKIRDRAFGLCYELSQISLSNVLDSIGESAFMYNYKLQSLTFPRSLRGFGPRAFIASGLTSINFESGSALTEIPDEVFMLCYLTSMSLPSSVEKIGRWAFCGNEFVSLSGLPDQLKEIGDSAFYMNQKMVQATIPSSVTSIGNGAFEECEVLETVNFGSNSKLQFLGDNAFWATSLKSFVMPDGITSLGKYQFPETLQSIQLSAGLKTISNDAFSNYNENLQTVTFGNNAQLETIGERAFQGLPLVSIELPLGLKSIGKKAFSNCKQLRELHLPSTLTHISDGAFEFLESLTEIILPEGVVSVGTSAFFQAVNVTSLSLPETLTDIGSEAFYGIGISALRLPKSVRTIGTMAFNSQNIRDVYVEWENNPATLGNQVFNSKTYNDGTLHVPTGTLSVYETDAGWKYFKNIDDGIGRPYVVFEGETLTFYCDTQRATREGTKYDLNQSGNYPVWYNNRASVTKAVFDPSFASARPTATCYWFAYFNKLTEIQGLSFLNTSEVTNMSLMFYECSKLTSLDVSKFNTENVTDMRSMFSGCKSLTYLDLGGFNTANVTYMQTMFFECSSLTSLNFSSFNTAKVTTMDWMFNGCASLESLDLSSFDTSALVEKNPDGNRVGDHAYADMFRNCSSITTLTLGNKFVTKDNLEINFAFGNNNSLKTIVFTGDIPASINSGFFSWVGSENEPVLLNVPAQYRDHYAAKFNGNMFYGGYFTLSSGDNPQPDAEPYVVYNNGTLTFYYDNLRNSRQGTAYDLNKNYWENPGWQANSDDIKKAIFDVSFSSARPTVTAQWFSWCSNLEEIEGIENLNTSAVTNMWFMFMNCFNLKRLDTSHFETSNVTDMGGMFSWCSSLTSLDVSNFNTQNVTNMNGMFSGCQALTSIDVSSFNTENVTNMEMMFSNNRLDHITFGSDFTTKENSSRYDVFMFNLNSAAL